MPPISGRLMQGSEILPSHAECTKVQDAYSIRCMPQVHGTLRDALDFIAGVVERRTERGHRQPARLPRHGRGALRRQFPRPADRAGVPTCSPPRSRISRASANAAPRIL